MTLSTSESTAASERSITQVLDNLAHGKLVVLVNGPVAYLVQTAQQASPESIAFIVRHTSGFVRVALLADMCARLELPQMVWHNENARAPEYTVTVDARSGTTTGISARDRCRTIRALADDATRADDLTRPGHVQPVRARTGGLSERLGVAEAAIDLAVLAGQRPVGVISELVSRRDDRYLLDVGEVGDFATAHRLPVVALGTILEFRQSSRDRADSPMRRPARPRHSRQQCSDELLEQESS